jgi:hypothetical protein
MNRSGSVTYIYNPDSQKKKTSYSTKPFTNKMNLSTDLFIVRLIVFCQTIKINNNLE